MTDADKIAMVKVLIDDVSVSDASVTSYLSLAETKILARLYPYRDFSMETVPAKYHMTQCELAARLWNRRGAEGQSSHGENGINRAYGSVDDADILDRVISYCGVPHENVESE